MKSKKIMFAVMAAAAVMTGCAGKGQQEKIAASSAPAETKAAEQTTISITTEKQNGETTAAETTASGTSGEKTGSKIIEPLPSTVDIKQLDDCTVKASFTADDVYMDGGSLVTHLTIYDQEMFDMVDISQMAVGDTLRIDGEDMVITTLEQNDYGSYIVNGGEENGGCDLWTSDDGVYSRVLFDDAGSYYKVGEVTLPIDQEFTFTDNSDLDNPGQVLLAGDFLQEIPGSGKDFSVYETTVRIEGGRIREITVDFTP